MAEKKIIPTGYKSFMKFIWVGFALSILAISTLFTLIGLGAFGDLPSFKDLENPEENIATEIISADGKIIGTYYLENRTPVSYNELPQHLVDALISTEDERFYEHSGIDFLSIARAVFRLGQDGGGSTITQQLAKQLFTKNYGTDNVLERIFQKLKEWVIAVKLEKQYTKNEIIAMYFNKYDFLYNAIGIRSAARIYFDKEPKELTTEESAILVGMAKNPSLYNPKKNPVNALNRRNTVLGQMQKNGDLSSQEFQTLSKTPLKIKFTPEGNSEGVATYFREYLRDYMKKWIKSHPKPDGTYYDLYSDGLKIHVTLDSRMQAYAEQAVQAHMTNLQRVFFKEMKKNAKAPFYDLSEDQIRANMNKYIRETQRYRGLKNKGWSNEAILKNFREKRSMEVFDWVKGVKDTTMSAYDSIKYYKHFLHAGLMAMEPQTGNIKAWVGGVNHKYFKYDHVKQGKRQVGSTFKPFVYASAISEFKISPCEKYPNTPYTIPAGRHGLQTSWSPKNSGGKYGGEMTLKEALAKSINVITARLIDKVGPQNVIDLARKCGIESELPNYPSISLGTAEISLYEMVGAYAVFANKGFKVEPNVIARIEDKNGVVLQQFIPDSKEVMSEEASYAVLDLLKGVTEGGSGTRLRSKGAYYPDNVVTGYPYGFTNPIAGKTGTTQNQSDGWFIGVVPNLSVGVWTGGEERAIHFKGIQNGQGATMSLPTWALFMKKCYADPRLKISKQDFEKPEVFTIPIDCGAKKDSTKMAKTATIVNDIEGF